MTAAQPLDVPLAHRQFSAAAFNSAWELIEKEGRTPEEDIELVCRAAASLWHWSQREDVTDQNLSIGYWQLSRVFALLGEANLARRCGELCLAKAEHAEPFYVAYAHEALARAAMTSGDTYSFGHHKREAERYLGQVTDAESRELLAGDLASIVDSSES